MEKLQLFVCGNFYPEFQEVLAAEEFEDVELRPFPSLCDQKCCRSRVKEILAQANSNHSALVCSKFCTAVKMLPENHAIRTVTGNYCFSHLTSDAFLNYLTSQGSYILSSGWLEDWERRIENMGFDEDTARKFFQETSKQLVLLDARSDQRHEGLIKELSSYVRLPYIIVPVEREAIRMMLRSLVYQWRLQTQEQNSKLVINQLRNQCAEYSVVFDMLGKISTYAKRREVIGQIKELFMMVFGAQSFNFWVEQSPLLPADVKGFQNSEQDYLLFEEHNRFCIKITWDDTLYGIIDVGGFLFPEYTERYLNLALEISKITGLVFHNNAQYEKILESEQELTYISYHDSMTDLFNRTYVNRMLFDSIDDQKACVFVFDIDRLKYVNDNFGHAEGDKLIKSFARILKQSFREDDIVARIGGDEFVAIVHDTDDSETIKQRIVELIEINNANIEQKHLELSVSIGYAATDNGEGVIEDLVKQADQQMYLDKSRKRSRT